MGDIDRSARSENGEYAGVVEADSVFWAVFDLRTGAENVSTRIRQITGRVVHLGTGE